MRIEKTSFLQIFETKFWQKLNESLVPFIDKPIDKGEFLANLYEEVTTFSYNPSHPREYILFNKHNGISRFVPTFDRKDYCVYYLCIKLLENEIAVNRVHGTYGGWTLGNPIRLKEEQELLELDYVPFNTLNDLSWVEKWRTFQGVAKRYKDLDNFKFFVNIDIANFYDSINLSLLERKIRHVVPKNKQEVVTLLMHFLHNWNKKLEGYNLKTVGIPQDEIGDCSRILANFYLQDYDAVIKTYCDKEEAKFIRFADDQIFYAKSLESGRKILFEACKELFKINLNVNSSKVKEFHTKSDFEKYWAFDIFDLLQDSNNQINIEEAVKLYFDNIDNRIQFRDESVLKRLLTMNFDKINPEHRHRLLSGFYNQEFLSQLSLWYFRRIREKVQNDREFFSILDSQIDKILFNSYHYQLLSFYSKDRKDFDLTILQKRIDDLKT
ncbi:MAG: RNA-directed DNA polymerase [Spirosomataceae bacterium]